MSHWYEIKNIDEIPSPSLLIYPDRIRHNIEKMIEMAGGVERLRPHVKTHKLPQLIAMQVDYGITKFKCATIAEAEMVAQNGGKDILIAHQLVGPNIKRLVALIKSFPEVLFSAIVDNEKSARSLSKQAQEEDVNIPVFIDINSGMNRSGISPGDKALSLYKLINELPNISNGGLHVYDGHIREINFEDRKAKCEKEFAVVQHFIKMIEAENLKTPTVIAGGSPTFPVHAQHNDRDLSPGTIIFWDYGYGSKFEDMDFLHAAVLLTRVVSKLENNQTCLDLGHKSVASEMPHPRVKIMGIDDFEMITHSEEHLVIKNKDKTYEVEHAFYAIPVHICPTVALHHEVYVVENKEVVDKWEVVARKRMLSI